MQVCYVYLLKCGLYHMTCDSMSLSVLCFLLLSFALTHSLECERDHLKIESP